MKVVEEVSAEKLRGGFYTSPPLVDACFGLVQRLLRPAGRLRFLEPAAGDGAFVQGLHRWQTQSRRIAHEITCIELFENEAAKCGSRLRTHSLRGEVVNDSFFAWADKVDPTFDALVGNPPFVRYQFVPSEDRKAAESLLAEHGLVLDGVSNLWIPFFLVGLSLLRPGGVFALVLPGELLSTRSAALVRSHLIREAEALTIEFYARGSFPGLLQDVIIVGGVSTPKHRKRRRVTFAEHGCTRERQWTHQIPDSGEAWTKYLLSKAETQAIEMVEQLPGFHRFGDVAGMTVSIVTGANDFFTVCESVVRSYGLELWAEPLLARTVDSPGILFKRSDRTRAAKAAKRVWLLNFAVDKPDPERYPAAAHYLQQGDERRLPQRYKCRIRSPWYRVPYIGPGSLLMAKRCHRFHRLLLNYGKVVTTDTIYRGEMKAGYRRRAKDLVGLFVTVRRSTSST